jgi:DNA-binding NarL/FixJ family response regulator
MKTMIRILIVDDHSMMRFALSQAMKLQPDLVLVGESDNGSEALELYRKHRPDVITMDFKLPGMNGVECTALIRKEFPAANVLLLSIFEGSEDIWRAMEAGAAGYVSKSADIKEVIHAIRDIVAGKTYFSPGLADKLASRQATHGLSLRELDVLREIVAGHNNKEIMNALKLAEPTVKYHITNIFSKLKVSDRAQAITTAIRRGIVHIDP